MSSSENNVISDDAAIEEVDKELMSWLMYSSTDVIDFDGWPPLKSLDIPMRSSNDFAADDVKSDLDDHDHYQDDENQSHASHGSDPALSDSGITNHSKSTTRKKRHREDALEKRLEELQAGDLC
jgi:hypothetical protein